MPRPVPREIQKQIRRWTVIAGFHRVTQVVLGLTGILCPLAVTAFGDAKNVFWMRILAFIGAAAIGIFAGFDIGSLATRFREAWKILNAAKLEYELDLIDVKGLVTAYKKGEKIIGRMRPDPFNSNNSDTPSPKTDATPDIP